jgi:hypothetical protein
MVHSVSRTPFGEIWKCSLVEEFLELPEVFPFESEHLW